jgi:hypothetical protein
MDKQGDLTSRREVVVKDGQKMDDCPRNSKTSRSSAEMREQTKNCQGNGRQADQEQLSQMSQEMHPRTDRSRHAERVA